jgi:Domain of unknown function (DUF4340)
MRTKVTLVLLLLNVVLFFFIFRFEPDWRTERAASEVRRRVLGAEAADIHALEVTHVAGDSFSLERRGEDWFLVKPLEWPANPLAVRRMLNDLQFLEHQTSFRVADLSKNGQSLDDYGLSQPKTTITFTSGGDTPGTTPITTTLRLGDTTQVGNRLYLLSPDGSRIHVVERELADGFSLPIEQIRADTLMTIQVFEARSLTLQAGGAAGVRVGIRREGDRWSFETPILSRANGDAIELAINGLDSLRVKSFAADAPSPSPADAPILQARIEGNNRSETLLVGGPAAGPGDYYAQLRERDELRPAVFIVNIPSELMTTLRNAQDELRERRILDFDPTAVTAITLAAPNQPELTLRRLEGGGADGSSWEIVRRGDGAQAPRALAADRIAMQRLLEQLAQFSAEKFQSDAPQAADLENWGFNRPEREITLTLGSPSGADAPAPQLDLQIGLPSQPDGLAYARLASAPSSVYAVATDILQETSVAPVAWRDRQLFDLAPKAIVSLALIDLTTGQALYRRSLAAGETWDGALAAEPLGRREALESVLVGLRTLRARQFILDSFAEQVNAGGEERTWRYRLDLGLSEPTGAGGSQTSVKSLWLTERVGGAWQYAGSPDFAAIFALEQPLIDALWTLTYEPRDPEARPPPMAGGIRP